jgi:phospholipid/cholesterol/gamma-HCH transport system substrate-binding protein
MEAKVNFAVVGAFVLILGAALIGGVLWLASGKSYGKAYDTYLVYMTESVSGLSLDAPVRYRGVNVGAVRRIALAPDDVERVRLTLAIERGTPIKQDTLAVLRTQGLTGIAHVELSGGSRDSPALAARPGEDHPVIRSGPSLMVRLDAAVTGLLDNLNRSSERLNALLDETNRGALKEILAQLNVLTKTVAARAAIIDDGVQNAAKTMENTARLTGELPQLVDRMRASADALERMANEVARAGAAAASTIEGAGAEGRRLAGETLPEARALLTELREVTASLRRIASEFERNPTVLLYGRPAARPGPGE